MKETFEPRPETEDFSPLEELQMHSERLVEDALEAQDERYGKRFLTVEKENGKKEEILNPDYLAYHNTWHVRGVIESVNKIIDALLVADAENKTAKPLISARMLDIAVLAAARHDSIQDWKKTKNPDGAILREMLKEDNETKTAKETVELMENINKQVGHDVYTVQEIEMVENAIVATIPTFDPELKTIVQPNLTKESDIVTRILALADLADAGLSGHERFLEGGKRLFREQGLDIAGAMLEDIPDEKKEQMIARMVSWMKFQETFALGRQQAFSREILGLPATAQKELARIFDKFEDTIVRARKRAEQLEFTATSPHISLKQRFLQSLEFFGYEIIDKNGKGWILP